MAILRKKTRSDNFTVLPNDILQNENLTYEARGLLCELLSRPQNWIIYKSQLITKKQGKTVINRIFKELQENGYLFIYNKRDNNKIIDRCWIASDEPLTKDEIKHEIAKRVENQPKKALYDTKKAENLNDRKPQRKETLIQRNRQLQNKDYIQKKDILQKKEKEEASSQTTYITTPEYELFQIFNSTWHDNQVEWNDDFWMPLKLLILEKGVDKILKAKQTVEQDEYYGQQHVIAFLGLAGQNRKDISAKIEMLATMKPRKKTPNNDGDDALLPLYHERFEAKEMTCK